MSASLSGRPLGAYSHHQSLLALAEWQERERENACLRGAVDEQGLLLDSLTLELRCHPPEIGVDNVAGRSTVVTIDSANRPGSLIFVSTRDAFYVSTELHRREHNRYRPVQTAALGLVVSPPGQRFLCPLRRIAGGPALHRAGFAHQQRQDIKRRRMVPRQ
jgi:hypothetical protein